MAVTVTYPGVYIEEVPSGVRTITGVATSITAFLGVAPRGAVNDPVMVLSYGEYERAFGGLSADSSMSYAVQQYFANGGSTALIVRVVASDAAKATVKLAAGASTAMELEASSPGAWGDRLEVAVDHDTADDAVATLFNLTITEKDGDDVVSQELFRNVSSDTASARHATAILANQSNLARVVALSATPDETASASFSGGSDGTAPGATEYQGTELDKTGVWALEKADLFNLMCVPPPPATDETPAAVLTTANAYCAGRRAVLLVDPPASWTSRTAAASSDFVATNITFRKNAAIYFPRFYMADPLQGGLPAEFVPCGVVAGVIARTDAQRGVWKAPAGLDAGVAGVLGLTVSLSDDDHGVLNPLGINCARTFPAVGNVIWGARTADGADRLASEWKYLPVRRLALFLEESLYRGCQWVVFEPNDEPLWAQIRLNVGSFMHQLFRKGAFQGSSPKEAYFVKCDGETTTQADRDAGIVNILVGFAPLKPAEFVVIKLQQMAGQLAT
jgi:uncharacterized protein